MTDDIYSLPKTRKEAIQLGSTFYFTGKPCKSGHIDKRRSSTIHCESCTLINREKGKAIRYEGITKWRRRNKNKHKEYCKKWCESNPTHGKEWRENNHHRVLQTVRLYQTKRQKAQPSWADKEQLNLIYQKRDELNEIWSTDFQVDHIIPLRSKTVCGLHCPDNLQLLDKSLNSSKGNSYQHDW